MGHRHISNQFMISGFDQHANNHAPAGQSYIPTSRAAAADNGPFVAPMDHPLRGGAHSNSPWDLGGRSHEHHSSYVSMEVQHHLLPHSSTNANTSLAPMNPVAHIHSSHYDVPSIGNINTDNRGPYKRKSHLISGCSSSSFYGAESSYSSQMLIENPAVNCHSLPPNRGSSLSMDGQDAMRNVRSRRGSELESCMPRTYVPGYASHFYQPATHSTSHSVPVHPVNLSADVVSQEWNPVPHAATSHGRNPPPDINGPRHEASRFHPGGSSIDIDAYHHSSFRRNLVSSSQHPHCSSQHPHVSSSQYPHVPSSQHPHIFSSQHPRVPSSEHSHVSSSQHPHFSHSQSTRDGHSYHPQLYTNGPSYCNYTHIGSSSANAPQLSSESLSFGYSRHPGWDSGYRSRRSRIVAERLQPIVSVMDSHDGLGYETLTVDQSSFYQNPRNFLDQYQDMRLDIDNMSYEELLALEESIGNVNTGLSEDGMSKCLREQVYYSVHQSHDESTCPICLEEYKNGEKVGRMEKCTHEYHVDCIKKWLLMKKVCPICKTEC